MGQRLNAHKKAEKLYALYEQKMYAVAYSILNDPWQAEDAVSEAFLKIIKNISGIRNPEDVKTKKFIIRVIQNTAIDLYRKNQRESRNFTVIPSEEQEQLPQKEDPIDELLARTGSTQEVRELLSGLPEDYRQVVVCRCIHELSVKETAAILEISESLVRKRYERARKLLIKKLGDEQYAYKTV